MRSSAIFLLAGFASSALADLTPLRAWSRGKFSVVRRQGIPDDCTFFDTATSASQDCEYFASTWGISVQDFILWNPAVGADCSGIQVGHEYCVERNYGLPPPSGTTITNGGSQHTNSVPSPVQEGIISTCTSYYEAASGDDCGGIVAKYGTFTFADFLKWNPAIGETCSSLWTGYYYCVGVAGTPTQPPPTLKATTTTTTTTGVPTQTGIISGCKQWHKAVSGDSCASIVSQYGTFTLQQFLKWNPAVGADCSGLWLGYNYCIGIAGTPTNAPRSTPTGCANAPSPTQPGAVCPCERWHEVQSGNTCATIQEQYGITAAQFHEWNPKVGTNCAALWLGFNVCVSA
ncbi:hypothetical protein SAMD00023353_0401860 [Rosellinia necatrix]|uniref:LysM domain-containing protein n=1 Tax=Rosellinia necatrix TaxID=77044 RepID=A0A1S7UIY1_ROSNE|nr:hypothetical protein SAMD00023353_0401860 [Rosellinia necatrix]